MTAAIGWRGGGGGAVRPLGGGDGEGAGAGDGEGDGEGDGDGEGADEGAGDGEGDGDGEGEGVVAGSVVRGGALGVGAGPSLIGDTLYGHPACGVVLVDGADSVVSRPKSCVQVPGLAAGLAVPGLTPTPRSRNPGARMFLQCTGLAIQLCTTSCGVLGPWAMFSPVAAHW